MSLGGVGAEEAQPDHVAVLGEDAFGRRGKGPVKLQSPQSLNI